MTNSISKRPILDTTTRWKDKHEDKIHNLEKTPRDLVIRIGQRKSGERLPAHSHGWGQLLYANRGLMTANTAQGIWVVPPHRAVWIPAFIEHEVRFMHNTSMSNVYISPSAPIELPQHCSMVGVTPLLRELIREASTFPKLYDENGEQGRLVRVLIEQIGAMQESAIHLPCPADSKLRLITDQIQKNPGDTKTLEDWAAQTGSSSRTLARKFRLETGMTFGQWRQQTRLLSAMIMLAEQKPVSLIADELGYVSQSAFIAMFKKATGKTPARYFSNQEH
ncbi:MAG: helix-turn-helix transcriptional regulator [Gammaproteobacteria bacterium]|nr:helix-turn-helix transcriptional regulator [Gammaproteobacteria bacterium]